MTNINSKTSKQLSQHMKTHDQKQPKNLKTIVPKHENTDQNQTSKHLKNNKNNNITYEPKTS